MAPRRADHPALHRPVTFEGPAFGTKATGLSEAIGELLEDRGPIALSAAAPDELADALSGDAMAASDVTICPTLRGRTVWLGPHDTLAIVSTPNRFGCLERLPRAPARSVVVVAAAGAPAPEGGPPEAACIVDGRGSWHLFTDGAPSADLSEFDAERRTFHRLTGRARLLSKRITQIARVQLAFHAPASPRFVILLPVDPVRVASRLRSVEGVEAATDAAAPLAGSLTVTLTADVRDRSQAEFVEDLAARIEESA